eukprot:jgi/Botrbrau1/2422/Bobra.0395s0046.1
MSSTVLSSCSLLSVDLGFVHNDVRLLHARSSWRSHPRRPASRTLARSSIPQSGPNVFSRLIQNTEPFMSTGLSGSVPHKASKRTRSTQCRVSREDVERKKRDVPENIDRQGPDFQTVASSAGGLLLWAAFAVYAIFLSPNQTPYRDSYFIEKLLGQGADDGVSVNTIFTQIWNLLGVAPALIWALLSPTAKSGNKVPIWPFTSLSLGLGFLALGPYFALWTPSKREKGAPSAADLEGWGNLSLRITESRGFAVLLLVGATVSIGQMVTASPEQWLDYLKLFDESRLVHVSSLDLTVLTCVAPFWMFNDAAQRDWQPRDKYLPFLAALPILGPVIYLVLRPRAGQSGN